MKEVMLTLWVIFLAATSLHPRLIMRCIHDNDVINIKVQSMQPAQHTYVPSGHFVVPQDSIPSLSDGAKLSASLLLLSTCVKLLP